MNKRVVLLFAAILGFIGAYIPVLFGIDNGVGGWSILGGLVGGLTGVWLAVWLSKRF